MRLKPLKEWISLHFPKAKQNPDLSKPRPYGLSEAQVQQLKALRSYEEWDSYLAVLDAVVALYSEAIMSAPSDAELRDHRGVVRGVRIAAVVVDQILSEEDKRAGAERSTRNGRQRGLATFGGPAWKRG